MVSNYLKGKVVLIIICCLVFTNCKAQTTIQSNTADFVIGKVEVLHSKVLNEDRTLNIYLPDGYNTDSSYSVIYLLDGGANEDFIHIAGLVQYNTFSWINQIPPSIVVGIANVDRERDFTLSTSTEFDKKLVHAPGGANTFIQFIAEELQPYINSRYSTNAHNTIIGQSLGGLLATEILFSQPRLFEKYIIISPSLWWNSRSILKRTPHIANTKQQIGIYIGVGKEGSFDGGNTMEDDAKQLAEKIESLLLENVTVHYDYMPKETHATSSHPAVFNAFRLLYPKNN